MGVIPSNLGGFTPICEDCGVMLCWDISEEEYVLNDKFWEEWLCEVCITYRRKKNLPINLRTKS